MFRFVECAEPPGAQVGLTSTAGLTTVALVIPGWEAAGTAALNDDQTWALGDELTDIARTMAAGDSGRGSVSGSDGRRLVLTAGTDSTRLEQLVITIYEHGAEAGTVTLDSDQVDELLTALAEVLKAHPDPGSTWTRR